MQTCDAFEQFAAMAAGMCMLVGGCDHPEACLNPPAEPAAGCEGWCDALLDVCPGLPWPDATTCAPLCTGVKMQVPAADPVGGQECLALLDQCPATPEEAVFGCLAAKCGLMCGLYGSCEPDSVYIETFGTFEECTEYCGTLSFGEGVAAGYCAMFAGCDNADKCMPPAEEAPEGCDTWCEVIEQLCPGNELVMPSLCLDACAGLSMVLPGAEPGLAEECLDEYDECPEEAGKVVYGCMVEEEPECVDVCADLDACGLTTDWLCAIFCTGLEQDDPSVHDLFVGCVQAADECDQMKPCVGQ
jgi:hypothetical protein